MDSISTAQKSVLSLGSNLGDRLHNLHRAADLLQAADGFRLTAESPIYETPPLGVGPEHGPFLNQVLIMELGLQPEQALALCRQVEEDLGRRRDAAGQPRPIDIDLITCGNLILDDEYLQLPHPRYRLRQFVLVPLKEAWPEFVDPADGSSIDALLRQCPDSSSLRQLVLTGAVK